MAKDVLGKKINGWTVGELISNGKSAAVFHSRNDAGVRSAIKIFDRELVEKQGRECQLERIDREKELKGKHHKNLIKILDGGYSDEFDYCFVVMEFLPGKTLSDVVTSFPKEHIYSVINQVASAAHFLEKLGLAHRDIKPDNIRILDDMTPVLLDLGVLRPFKGSKLTDGDSDNKSFIGTLQYSPPEFLLREEDDSVEGWRSITFYQLGAVLHDLIMRRPLFHNLHPYAKIVNAVQQTTPLVAGADIPKELILLAKKCLLKDWKKRLECVDWSDFTKKTTSIDIDDIRGKISRNKLATQALQFDQKIMCQNSKSDVKLKLEELSESLHKIARRIRTTNKDIFPPMESEVAPACNEDTKHISISFSPSMSYGLNANFTLFLIIKLIDAKEKAVNISLCGKVSGVKDTSPPCTECENIMRAYVGIFDNNHVEQLLTPLFLLFFEKAQETAVAKSSIGVFPADSAEYIHIQLEYHP